MSLSSLQSLPLIRSRDFLKQRKLVILSLFLLTVIALIVWTQNYFKHSNEVEYSLHLSLLYNLIVYSSFSLVIPIILYSEYKVPYDSDVKIKSIAIHIVVSLLVCFIHMFVCNLILYSIDLVSSFPFPRFIWKYLTGVVHVHLIIYWAIFGAISIANKSIKEVESHEAEQLNYKFKVSMNNEQYFIPYDEVYWIEALDHYQKLHTETGQHIIKNSMSGLENSMPKNIFCRAHRSYFVNVDKIKSVYRSNSRGHFVKLLNGETLKVSDSYKNKLLPLIK